MEHGTTGGWRSKGWRRVVGRKRGTVIVPPPPSALSSPDSDFGVHTFARTHARMHKRPGGRPRGRVNERLLWPRRTRIARLTTRAKSSLVSVCVRAPTCARLFAAAASAYVFALAASLVKIPTPSRWTRKGEQKVRRAFRSVRCREFAASYARNYSAAVARCTYARLYGRAHTHTRASEFATIRIEKMRARAR